MSTQYGPDMEILVTKVALSLGLLLLSLLIPYIPPMCPELVLSAVLILWVSVLACFGFYLIKLMAKFPPIVCSKVS